MKYFSLFISSIIVSSIWGGIASASNIGEPLSTGFYSRIHDNIDSNIDILRKKELSKFKTFSGFGGTCRGSVAWLDREPMNESVLQNLIQGNLLPLSQIMSKNKQYGSSDTESFANLVNCLSDTYRQMGSVAAKDEKAITEMGLMGLYTDGNTENSDYDIVDDIEKINSILFTEKLGWNGKINISKETFETLMLGGEVSGVTAGSPAVDAGETDSIETPNLGIGDACTSDAIPSNVSNIADEDFLSELQGALAGNTSALGGATYGGAASPPIAGDTLYNDVFDALPCGEHFCVKVKMVPGNANLLSGGQSYSIESLLDKHIAIMEKTANSNLSAHQMSRNSFKDMTLQAIMKKWLAQMVYLDTNSPQEVKNLKNDQTQEEFEKSFEELRRCAYASAGINSTPKLANILCGVGYQMDMTNTTENTVGRSEKSLCAINPDDRELVGGRCMDVFLSKPRSTFYSSFETDMIELDAFNSAMVEMLSQAIESHKLLDKKKRY